MYEKIVHLSRRLGILTMEDKEEQQQGDTKKEAEVTDWAKEASVVDDTSSILTLQLKAASGDNSGSLSAKDEQVIGISNEVCVTINHVDGSQDGQVTTQQYILTSDENVAAVGSDDHSSTIMKCHYPEISSTPVTPAPQEDPNNAFIMQTPYIYTWPNYDASSTLIGSASNMYIPANPTNSTGDVTFTPSEVFSFDTSSVVADVSAVTFDTSLLADTSISVADTSSIFQPSLLTPSIVSVHPSAGKDAMQTTVSKDASAVNVKYPLVYVSPAGLLTVLLKHDVAVELTADHTIRVVNHRHKCVASTNKRATASCIYHTAAKIYQDGTHVDAEVFWERKAHLTPDYFHYGMKGTSYKVDARGLITNGVFEEFKDLSQDNSVTLLFSSSAYGPHLVHEYEKIASASKFHYLPAGAVSVYINGVKIKQSARGDVTVTSGPKFIRVSPSTGSVTVHTHFVDMAVDNDWNIRIRRGGHRLSANFIHFLVSDGSMQYGFDKNQNHIAQQVTYWMETLISSGQLRYRRDWQAYKIAMRSHRKMRIHLSRMKHFRSQLREDEEQEVPFQLGGDDMDSSFFEDEDWANNNDYETDVMEQEEDEAFKIRREMELPPRFRSWRRKKNRNW